MVPTARVRTIAASSGRPRFFQNTPSMMADMPKIDPTDRSMPPVMMTKVMMMAISPTSVISRPWFNRLSSVKNLSDWVERTNSATTTSTARMVS